MLSLAKSDVRRLIRRRFAAVSPCERAAQSLAVSDRLSGSRLLDGDGAVGIFLSRETEVDTAPIIARLFASGVRVFVPTTADGADTDMRFLEVADADDIAGLPLSRRLRLREPTERDRGGTARIDGADVMSALVCPGAAFCKRRHRIGFGRGYYDRYIAAADMRRRTRGLPPMKTIGIALREQIVERMPIQPHDVRMTAVVTADAVFVDGADVREECGCIVTAATSP